MSWGETFSEIASNNNGKGIQGDLGTLEALEAVARAPPCKPQLSELYKEETASKEEPNPRLTGLIVDRSTVDCLLGHSKDVTPNSTLLLSLKFPV